MGEKVIIESKQYGVKKIFVIVGILAFIVSLILFINYATKLYDDYSVSSNLHCAHSFTHIYDERPDFDEFKKVHPSFVSYMNCRLFNNDIELFYSFLIPYAGLIVAGFIYFWLHSYTLTVTDKRIVGKTAFGRRVDLPTDKVSSVGTSMLKGVSVGTSSGAIKFILIKNQEAVHSALSNLLLDRQTDSRPTASTVSGTADELQKFKSLLDSGVITEEEFAAKKNQLLGL